MDNFFTNNKTSSNYSRTYSKGKSFKFSVWNSKDTYNNDEFVQDFVQWNQKLWAAKKTSTNIPPIQGDYWELVVDGVSDVEFKQENNRILWKYEDDLEWKDLFELASVSEDQIRKMLEDLDIKYGNTYDVKLSETSTNAVQNQVVTKKFKELDDKNTRTDNELTNIKSSVNTALSNSKSYTDLKISETKIKIDSELNKKANQTDIDEVVDVLNENINLKVDKVPGKELSTNDFNDNYKSKLDNLDSSLNSALTSAKSYTNSEITKVGNKINSEISRAQASEMDLSGRINDLEEDLVEALQEAKEYTDSLANGEVKNNTNKINTLNGTGEGSVIKTVKDEISNIIGTAPEKLDTLQEIADYLEEHEDMASGLVESLSSLEKNKVDKEVGKGLSTEDYTTTEKNKLASLENYDDTTIKAELNKKVENTELVSLSTRLDKDIESLEKSKANTTGYYPQMSVGTADDLAGRGESVPAEFSFRASGGKSIKDGTARIKRLKGNSVVWNNQSGLRLVNQSSPITALPLGATFISGHKYLYTGKNKNSNIYIYYNIGEGNQVLSHPRENDIFFFTSKITITANGKASAVGGVWIYQLGLSGATEYGAENIRITNLTQMFGAGNEPTTIEEFNARKPIVEDEYAYNEGEVIHMTAEGIKSVGDNAFNGVWYQGAVVENSGQPLVGSLTNIYTDTFSVIGGETYCSQFDEANLYLKGYFFDKSGAFIGSSDFDVTQGTKKWVVPINADSVRMRIYNVVGNIAPSQAPNVMITLVHSGWKQDTDAGYQPYWEDRLIFDQRIKDAFPNGMKKWDMVYNKDGKGYIVKGTGVVDMGDLNWELAPQMYFRTNLPSDSIIPTSVNYNGFLCAKYERVNFNLIYGQSVTTPCFGVSANNGMINVYDSAYTDAASFKAAMAGVPLYYELAEPTIIEYDEPFNLDYRVADFGTEQAIAEQPSAPISADIIYQFNAVDMIRKHEIEIEELKTTIVNLQTLITQLQTSISSMGGVINEITVTE